MNKSCNYMRVLPRDDNSKKLSWQDVEFLCESVACQIIASKYEPDLVIGLLWGGAIPTRIIMDMANIDRKKVAFIETKYYDGTKKRESVEILGDLRDLWIKDKKILIIDDIYDTGKTIKVLKKKLDCPKSVKTATLVCKGKQPKGSYNALTIPDKSTWVVFPWETNEYNREKEEEKV